MADEVIGRDDEVGRLRAFLEAPTPEGPTALALEGEAGIGKSTLWLNGLELARERGFRILSSRPAEGEHALVFAGLGDLFEGVLDDVLLALAPPRRRALEVALLVEDAHDPLEPLDPRALGVAVRSALELLAGERPTLLAVDDVQWLDGSSADALGFALRRLASPLHVLLARRLGEVNESPALEAALPATSIDRLQVGPLSPGALQALVRTRLERGLPRPTLVRIHEMSGGNPFYALEIARAIPLDVDPAQPLPVPETLDDLVRTRIEALPTTSRQALVLLAAMGEGDMATLRSADVEDALEAAIAHGIVERADGRLRFTHPLLGSSAYRGADAATRRSSHAALAAIVSDRIERARHLALSTQEPDPEIAAIVDEAAELASARGAGSLAVALRAQALRLTPANTQDHIHRRAIALARAQHHAGAPLRSLESMAKETLDRAASASQRAEALRLAGELTPDVRTAIDYRRQAIDEAEDDPRLQCRLHSELAWDVHLEEGLHAAERHAQACVAIAERIGDDGLRGAGLIILSTIHLHMARPDALLLGEQGYELAYAEPDARERAWNTLAFTRTLIWSFQLTRARALLEQLDHEWSARDEEIASHTFLRLAFIELFAGHLDAAADFADRVEVIDNAYGWADNGLASAIAQIAAWHGDLERARSLAARALESRGMSPWYMPFMETVLGQVAQWSGVPDLAVEHFSRAEDARAASSLEPNLARWRADYTEALVQVGRTDDAVSLLESWEAEAARVERGVVLAQVTRCRGLVAAARGDVAAAETLLERAVDEHAAVGDPLGRARALLALGTVRRRVRKRSAAREAIREAAAIFQECGASGWEERARSELGRIGGRRREEGLTAAERRVAALVAEGKTNREVAAALVLGERTVETHLTRIYAKLGVRSRTELARAYESAI
jgi:DNA-binding CsgD family transcriptional regulator